ADKIKAALNDMKRVQSMYRITQTPIQNNQLQEGIQKCVTNSVRLLEDSKLLMKNKRFLSAIVLASLSLEECGKGVILLERLKAGQDVGSTSWETLFEDHNAKLRAPAPPRLWHKTNQNVDIEFIVNLTFTAKEFETLDLSDFH